MRYRYLATSIEGVVQLIAASYLRHGYYWYMTGRIPSTKSAATIDEKLIKKYKMPVATGKLNAWAELTVIFYA